MAVFGRKEIFLIELGVFPYGNPQQRIIEIWVCGQRVTHLDNVAYLPEIVSGCEKDLSAWQRVVDFSPALEEFESAEEIHRLVDDSRGDNFTCTDFGDDELWPAHSVLNWGPNTDDATCFLIWFKNQMYLITQIRFEDESEGPVKISTITQNEWHSVLALTLNEANSRKR